MATIAKRFIFNRKSDFTENGIFRNVLFQGDELCSDPDSGESSVFISKSFNSGIGSCTWNRIRITADVPENSLVDFRIYCSNEQEVIIQSTSFKGREKVNLDNFLIDENVDFNRKISLFKSLTRKNYRNVFDILPCDLEGRFMWFFLEITSLGVEPVKISKIRFEFPKISFTEYLPEIYRSKTSKDNFLERFIGVFQSIYIDFEEQIDNISSRFDVEEMTKSFLNWVVSWLNIADTKLWPEEKLRILLKKIVKLYKIKGTKLSVFAIVNEFCGVAPIIVEQFELKKFDFYKKYKADMEKLYGETGRVFTVILKTGTIKSSEEYIAALRVINSVKPVDAICNLVVLSDKFYLGHHLYLGINSFVTKNYDLVLDNNEKDINTLTLRN